MAIDKTALRGHKYPIRYSKALLCAAQYIWNKIKISVAFLHLMYFRNKMNNCGYRHQQFIKNKHFSESIKMFLNRNPLFRQPKPVLPTKKEKGNLY